jgi:hypothetical protein
MRKKYIYLLENMQMAYNGNEFRTYDRMCFSSKKNAIKTILNIIEVNKGYNVVISDEATYIILKDCLQYDYSWKSEEFNRDVQCRLFLRKIVVQ